MKQTLSIVLALALVFNIFGYYVIYIIDRMAIQHEMKALIHSGIFRDVQEEVIVTDPLHDREFVRVGKSEFRYMGRMYDVISERYEGNSIVFTCINDRKEEGLTANYEKLSDLMNGLHSPVPIRHRQILAAGMIKHALIVSDKETVMQPASEISFCYTCCFLTEANISLDTPPPEA